MIKFDGCLFKEEKLHKDWSRMAFEHVDGCCERKMRGSSVDKQLLEIEMLYWTHSGQYADLSLEEFIVKIGLGEYV